ncbi:prephenate dehydrogenase, partial [Candidatus Saccharibacteria bacterium]|nr:prephenate dehydrogenase [Candidatus Saccharibacteria bacterium]
LEVYKEMLPKIAKLIKPEALVIDVCSVKKRAEQLLSQYLPGHSNVLATHPLFGPQAIATGIAGCKLVVTKSSGELAGQFIDFCHNELGLTVIHMSADKHDKAMAQVHAVTFFVAKGLANLNIGENDFITPSYRMILDLVSFDKRHSKSLFDTIERGNPYAADIRKKLVDTFDALEKDLEEEGML